MAKKKITKRRLTNKDLEPVARNCPYCKANTNPDYKDGTGLIKFVSDRAKILGKDRTGICAKHQRRMSIAIKRARHLALLPYIPTIR
ncbi:MAG TPA: 30S ribosomal protein S18 [Patescibacteria group bacterium]|nr:30S ribosomal protein S18 [Patescibacteria group bacterium]